MNIDGTISTVAGIGAAGYGGDGELAVFARLGLPEKIALTPDGSLYIAESGNHTIRRVDPEGYITTVAGTGAPGFAGDSGPAALARLRSPAAVGVASDGSLYIVDSANARIRKSSRPSASLNTEGYLVPSDDGDQIYQFAADGRHLRTIDAVTNAVMIQFQYDSEGRLTGMEDAAGNLSHIERNGSGTAQSIVGPFGQATGLAFDANGYLQTVEDPLGHDWRMEYSSNGLMTAYTDRAGNRSEYTFEGDGRLARDLDPLDGGWHLSREETAEGYSVSMTSGEGRVSGFDVIYRPDGIREQVSWDSETPLVSEFADGRKTTRAPDGTVTVETEGADPRFGLLSPRSASISASTPEWSSTTTFSRSAQLADSADLMSLSEWSETTTRNGKSTVEVYRAVDRTWTSASPSGRVTTIVADALSRPVGIRTADLAEISVSYDARGRLSALSQGDGAAARTTAYGYHASGDQAGYLASVTDAMGRQLQYQYDAMGRVIEQTFPDGRVAGMDYDPNGNLITLTTPSGSVHAFDYNAVDQESVYTAPDIPGIGNVTQYSYNLDRQLTQVLRPDGKSVGYSYGAGNGRLVQATFADGNYFYSYNSSNQLRQIAAPGNVLLNIDYSGFLMTEEIWSGDIAGTVGRQYDGDHNVTSLSVGSDSIDYLYDSDGLITAAGTLSLSRDSQSGLVTSVMLDSLATVNGYNEFGEVMLEDTQGDAALSVTISGQDASSGVLQVSGQIDGVGGVSINGVSMTVTPEGNVSGEIPLPLLGDNPISVDIFDASGQLSMQRGLSVERHSLGSQYTVDRILAISSLGDVYFMGGDGSTHGVWVIPAGNDSAQQPGWLAGASDVAAAEDGKVYLLKDSGVFVYDGASEVLFADLAAGGLTGVQDIEVGPDGSVYALERPGFRGNPYLLTGMDTSLRIPLPFEADVGNGARMLASSSWGWWCCPSGGLFSAWLRTVPMCPCTMPRPPSISMWMTPAASAGRNGPCSMKN